jgi:hypothetical protein
VPENRPDMTAGASMRELNPARLATCLLCRVKYKLSTTVKANDVPLRAIS